MVMQWKCSDVHHHQLIFCGLEPWSSYLSCPQSVHLFFGRWLDKANGRTWCPVVHYIGFFFSKNVNPMCNGYAMKVLRYAPSSTYLLRARTRSFDDDWTKQIAWPEVRSSTLLNYSPARSYAMKVLRYASSSTYPLRTRTMKQLSIWPLICPLKCCFFGEDQAKSLAGPEVRSSTLLNSSSVRMSTHCTMVMQWKCSDMHHHRLIFCGLEPWSSYLYGPWSVH